MTVGEKIQFYRKKIGISQEELGQKLFVSRQTISLWEMDKTLPTVDNLIRLKDIFSVTIDEILSDAEPTEAENAKENYVFQYSKEDLRGLYKYAIRPTVKRLIIFAVAFIFLFISFAATDAPDSIIGLTLGAFIFGVIAYVRAFVVSKKSWNANEKRILDSVYQYEVYEKHFVLNVSKNGEITKTFNIKFEEIEKISTWGRFFIIQYGGQSYLIDKEALDKDSHLLSFCSNNPSNVDEQAAKSPLKTVSILLLIFSIASIVGGGICVAIMSHYNYTYTDNMWVFFLFTPIPIASLIFGLWLKKKSKKFKKNVVVGIVMTVLLCLYGSFTFIFAGIYTHDDAPLLRIEETLAIDVPDYLQITTQDWTKGTQTTRRGYIYSTSDVYFDENAVKSFEAEMQNDYRWISAIPSDLVGVTSFFCDYDGYDYYVVYNVSTGEFNKLPDESGRYEFINVLYNSKNKTMKIVEYEIAYTK